MVVLFFRGMISIIICYLYGSFFFGNGMGFGWEFLQVFVYICFISTRHTFLFISDD